MINYYAKRIGQMIVSFLAVVTASFALIRLMPGGPMDYIQATLMQSMNADGLSEVQDLAETYTNINPGEPIWVAYFDYVTSILQGDLGRSFWFDEPVAAILAEALPWTLFIMVTAFTLTFTINMLLGSAMAYYEGSRFDSTVTVLGVFTSSIPYYIIAIIFIAFFGYELSLFPIAGRMGTNVTIGWNLDFLLSVLYHGALPIGSLFVAGLGAEALLMRGNSIRVLGEDYVRVARLRGLKNRRIALRYVGKNAFLPMYTSLLIRIGTLFGGSVILETIFNYPGLGYYLFRALETRDYSLLMGGFILITSVVLLGIFVADLTYGLIDPRIKTGDQSEAY